MTDNDALLRVDREHDTRDAFGVIAIAFGLILLTISALCSWGPPQLLASDFRILLLTCTAITILVSIANLFRARMLFGAIAQALSAFATMLASLVFAFASHLFMLGPAALSSLFGALLVAIGGIARINGESADEIVDETTASGGGGRKWVYRGNRVVAVEQWVDGKLVSTEPVVPTIAR